MLCGLDPAVRTLDEAANNNNNNNNNRISIAPYGRNFRSAGGAQYTNRRFDLQVTVTVLAWTRKVHETIATLSLLNLVGFV